MAVLKHRRRCYCMPNISCLRPATLSRPSHPLSFSLLSSTTPLYKFVPLSAYLIICTSQRTNNMRVQFNIIIYLPFCFDDGNCYITTDNNHYLRLQLAPSSPRTYFDRHTQRYLPLTLAHLCAHLLLHVESSVKDHRSLWARPE